MKHLRKTLAFGLPLLLLMGCVSPQKVLESGNYDRAIDLTIRKLAGKKKKKPELVRTLETAFQKANQQDMRLAETLRNEDRDENWDRINQIYRRIADRQRKIEPLLPLIDDRGNKANFQFVRVEELEQLSREKAAAYYYNNAMDLLKQAERGDKGAAREALASLDRIGKYYSDYRDVRTQRQRALQLGRVHILIRSANVSQAVLPQSFEDELLRFSVNDLNSTWRRYYTQPEPGMDYDYTVLVKITDAFMGPEQVKEREYVDHREIEEGFEYVLDERGNVMKDSLGNDIKVPKKVFIQATIFEVYQFQMASVSAKVEYLDDRNDNLLGTENLAADAVFENYASTFRGDRRALSKVSQARIGNRPLPFPPRGALLMDAAQSLRQAIRQEIGNNRYLW